MCFAASDILLMRNCDNGSGEKWAIAFRLKLSDSALNKKTIMKQLLKSVILNLG